MKLRQKAMLAALFLGALCLSGCGQTVDLEAEAFDLMFRSDTDAAISSVSVTHDGETAWTATARQVDGCSLKRGESFSFAVEEYPVTVAVYGDEAQCRLLAALTVLAAPPEEGRWYIVAQDEQEGMALSLSSYDPAGNGKEARK